MLVTSLALQQIKEVVAVTVQGDVIINTCKIQYYTILALSITMLGLMLYAVLHSRIFKMCRGCLFSNAVKIRLFIFDVQHYISLRNANT